MTKQKITEAQFSALISEIDELGSKVDNMLSGLNSSWPRVDKKKDALTAIHASKALASLAGKIIILENMQETQDEITRLRGDQ